MHRSADDVDSPEVGKSAGLDVLEKQANDKSSLKIILMAGDAHKPTFLRFYLQKPPRSIGIASGASGSWNKGEGVVAIILILLIGVSVFVYVMICLMGGTSAQRKQSSKAAQKEDKEQHHASFSGKARLDLFSEKENRAFG